MNATMSSRFAPAARLLARAILTLTLGVPAVRAECVYTVLTSGSTVHPGTSPYFYRFDQAAPYWSAVAIRPVAGEDWDVSVWQSTAGEPDCVQNLLAVSNAYGSVVDFVIGDFNQTPTGSYYVGATHFDGVSPAKLQWDDGADRLWVDYPPITESMDSEDIIRVWDVYLEAGQQYAFHFNPQGSADLKLLVFQNLGGALWTNRSQAILWTDDCTGLTPGLTGWYGVVAVNDNGGTGSFELAVSSGLCTCPNPMQSGVVLAVGAPATSGSFQQVDGYWTAVGLRGDPGADYDLFVYADATGGSPPVCFGSPLTDSFEGAGFVDVVVGDFNLAPTPFSPNFVYSGWFEGSGLARMEWDSGADILSVNTPAVARNTGPDDVLEVWDVLLYQGHLYTISLDQEGPLMELLLFANPGTGLYWTARNTAALQLIGTGSQSSVTFEPSQTGWYGLVAVNRDGGAGTYAVRVSECEAPRLLESGEPLVADAADWFEFAPDAGFWSAVGVRHATEDFDVVTLDGTWGAPAPFCASTPWGYSMLDGTALDYVAMDFNHHQPEAHFAYVSQYSLTSVLGGAMVEFDNGAHSIGVNAPAVHRDTGPGDVLECWDVYLSGGYTYDIRLAASAGVEARVDLLQTGPNSIGIPVLSAPPPGGTFTPPVSDWYGLLVLNLNGGAGSYDVRVSDHTTAVDDGAPPAVSGLIGVRPNPSRGSLRMEYGLSAGASVGFEALDMAGRVVWRRAPEAREPGRATLEWAGMGSSGERLAPGLYFVRMTVDGRTVSNQKVTLLE